MVGWATPLYKEVGVPTGGSPNNILISPGDMDTNLY